MTRQEHIEELLEEYARRRAAAEAERDQRIEKTRQAYPEIDGLIEESRRMVGEGAKRLALDPRAGREIAADLRKRSEEWNIRLQTALKRHHLPEDQLSLRSQCPYCKDFGYLENTFPRRYCACFESALVRRMSEAVAGPETFETFSLEVFPATPMEGREYSQRTLMERYGRLLRKYADTYPHNPKPNITLLGKSGLGKTFLLNCVAARLRDRGHPVMQMTAFRMVEAMRRRHLGGYEARDTFDEMLDAPCLILDDLGSEPMLNNITIEYLFTLLNERCAACRPTLVATNFGMQEMLAHYNERIASRLLDAQKAHILLLEGRDLRTGR